MPKAKPAYIRPHLVPFLFNEFEGVERLSEDKRVKVVEITNRSSLGKWLIKALKNENADKISSYHIFLSLDVRPGRIQKLGNFYTKSKNKTQLLHLSESDNDLLNELLEDIFRITLYYFVVAYRLDRENEITIIQAIREYMEMYELYEYGFDETGVRQLYYRTIKSGKLKRIQYQAANRVHNYI